MVEFFSRLKPTRVFVPLCGKSLDLKWLHDQGFDVLGVEWNETACREFFVEHEIPFQEVRNGALLEFRGERISIFSGDFFDLKPEHLGKLGAVYDRAALIALPPETRARYAQRMIELTRGAEGERFLLIVLERVPTDPLGPPFSIQPAEIEKLYGARFEIKPLSRERLPDQSGTGAAIEECVYELKARLGSPARRDP